MCFYLYIRIEFVKYVIVVIVEGMSSLICERMVISLFIFWGKWI